MCLRLVVVVVVLEFVQDHFLLFLQQVLCLQGVCHLWQLRRLVLQVLDAHLVRQFDRAFVRRCVSLRLGLELRLRIRLAKVFVQDVRSNILDDRFCVDVLECGFFLLDFRLVLHMVQALPELHAGVERLDGKVVEFVSLEVHTHVGVECDLASTQFLLREVIGEYHAFVEFAKLELEVLELVVQVEDQLLGLVLELEVEVEVVIVFLKTELLDAHDDVVLVERGEGFVLELVDGQPTEQVVAPCLPHEAQDLLVFAFELVFLLGEHLQRDFEFLFL